MSDQEYNGDANNIRIRTLHVGPIEADVSDSFYCFPFGP